MDYDSSKLGCICSQRQREVDYFVREYYPRIIFGAFALNSRAHKRTDPIGNVYRSRWTSMDATQRAKIHLSVRESSQRQVSVLENSIRKRTTRENKWLSQFGSRLINRSQFPPSCVHTLYVCLFSFFFLFLFLHTAVARMHIPYATVF